MYISVSPRLAPGEVNRTLLALYLAVFSMRVPEGLTGLLLSVPAPACGDKQQDRTLCIQPLLQGCPHLVELELIGAGFSSALPRNEPAMRKDPAVCSWSHSVGDGELAALGGLKFLRKLTLAHLPGVLKGTGLIELVQGCRELQSLSLANLGSLKMMNYTQALLETLTYCTQLRDLR